MNFNPSSRSERSAFARSGVASLLEKKGLRWNVALLAVVLFGCLLLNHHCVGAQTPLTSVEYHIGGTSFQVTPAALSVPKGIAGSVLPLIESGGSTNNGAVAQLTQGAYVQAVLRGPGISTPQRLVAAPNTPLMLPALPLVGDYELDNVELVDATTGKVRLEASPSSVPVHVFDQVLISTVTSQPLTLDQIKQKGIAIDGSNFKAVEFNVSFVLNGQTIPVSFPVVSPKFTQSTELIPADQVQAKLQQAAALNQQIASTVQLPAALTTSNLNIQIQGINFQVVDPGAGQSLGLTIPPIPALMVIPGNIGYLHEFFSVRIFTENGAPLGSGLTVSNVEATLQLPPGPDGILSTNYNQPGDDPLRFARIGPNKIIEPIQPIVDPGPDGQLGTADDINVLQPGETGQGEFLVEGLQEGLHVMNVNLTGDLYGLAAGMVHIQGKAAGAVLVRNPSFSITFTHPDTVRVGEPYTASITVLNTADTPANLVQVTLNKNSISGAVLAANQPETIQLGTILPGQTATATYQMIAERTGQIQFSDLTTGDASVTGQFRFTMGVDAQGVALSPDTIAMPDYVNYLPTNLVAAANRVLGQALSIATAARLPVGIVPVDQAIITRRVLDLAEAGQRVQYGDPLYRVLPDLLRDWQGGRVPDTGFDSLLRTSDAGAEWRSVLFQDMEAADNLDGTQQLTNRAADLAGLSQQFVIASASPGQLRADFSGTTNNAIATGSSEPYSMVYDGTNGEWAVTPYLTNAVFTWTFTNGPPTADMAVLLLQTNGQAQQFRWQIVSPPVTAVYHFALNDPSQQLQVDENGDGTIDSTLAPDQSVVHELPPAVIAVQQDLTVNAGRPTSPCINPPDYGNYGTVVAVVFSKPMTQATAGATNSYAVDGDNGADSVQVQPSGRVALLNLRQGISAIIPRKLTITGVTDEHGNPLVTGPIPIQCYYPGTTNPFTGGVAVTGRVLGSDGIPAAGVPVTLTMYDQSHGPYGCQDWTRRVSQVLTDPGGNFNFDFVMSGIPYSISASDTSGISSNALQLIMQSTVAGSPDSQILEQLISASSDPNSLLAMFSAGSVPQAVAIVEGLDRAVFHDVVPIGSSREGQTVPVALQFRGRATVEGQVVASDGVTPVPNAAVNLFPDPSSQEQGRGVFADAGGDFAFPGVPLGVFTVQVATSDGRGATVIGDVSTPGAATNLVIALPDNPVLYGDLRGEVYDSDNVTPVPNARIYVGHYNGETMDNVVAIANADSSGAWEATNVPIQNLDVVAVTFDGSRMGLRRNITPVANQPTYVNIALQAATTVYGQVQFDDGQPATNALVAGGSALVRSDANGNFQLQGVPVGHSTISAGLEANPSAGIDFPRLGSTTANIVAGTANYVVVKLNAAGRIFGKVFDAQGNVQPGIRVAIPDPAGGGFYWTVADTNGNYSFNDMPLGHYTVSAPANAVAPQLNTSQLGQEIASGQEQQILAAFKEAATVFVGANDPLLNGEGLNFHPSSWGYTTANLDYDGQDVNADIHFIPQGSISGKVLNSQGIPIGAEVRLTGLGPDTSGNPVVTVRGDTTSDPATGEFGFTNILLAGPWGLQAASPFYPSVIQTNGFTTALKPDVSGVVLQFPPVNDVNGRIAGHVFNPDGSLVGQGAQVHISVSADYQIETDTNGYFDTQTEFPAVGRSYEVDVFDPASGLKGRNFVAMTPGITNFVDVHLLSRNSTIQVTVLRADGVPAVGAQIELDQNSWPNDSPLFAVAGTNGAAVFSGLWEGSYSVKAQYTENSTRLFARAGVTVGANQTAPITLRMGATGSIDGTFVKQDGVTRVPGAEVAIGNLGLATTDTNGFFQFDGVPLGTYTITSSDPVTGGNAVSSATLSYNDQTQTVQLVEATLGTVSGLVLDPYGNGFVAGASVKISFSDGLTPSRTVTTDPNGRFNFPASPMGAFTLNASYTLPGTVNQSVSGQAKGTLSAANPDVQVNIQLQPLTSLQVHVVQNDGVTPAQNARVTVNGVEEDTSTNGDAIFNNLLVPKAYLVRVISQVSGDTHDGAQTNVSLTLSGTNSAVTLRLPGVGNVSGTVVAGDGSTPVDNAQISLQFQTTLFNQTVTTASDAQGKFAFSDVPIGQFLVTASSQSLAASESGTINTAGETNQLSLRLGASGTLMGVLVRADGVTPVPGMTVAIDYTSQSSNPGRAQTVSGTDGSFRFDNVPVGAIHVTSAAPSFGGIINFTTALTTNGEVLNLGNVPYDEDLPQVVQVTPPDATLQVPITNDVELLFNEALETNSIHSSGIFIEGPTGAVDSAVTLLPDTNGVMRLVRIQPKAPLQSLQVYEVVVLAGDLTGPTGGIIGSGPRDLVGRAMAAPFESRFATADNTPPQLLSMFPSNNAVQIDPSAVPRLTFDKTINPTNFVFSLTGPGGAVAGTASLGINGQVMTFLPAANLQPNATYSMTISNVFDLAGNAAVGQPYKATFATIDTIGPTIASLEIASNAVPVGGATVPIVAVLATNEPGASVRFTQDFTPIGSATNPPYQIMVTLPKSGSTTIRAIATDQYGNDGQFVALTIPVQAATPPTLQFIRVSPTNGPLRTGSSFIVDVTASADTGISNFTALAGGAAQGTLMTTNGDHLRVQGLLPTNAVAGQDVQVFAQVTDDLGLSSGQQVLTIPTVDATPPALAILSPTNNALFNPGDALSLAALASDNSSNLTLNLSISGSVTATQTVALTLTPNQPLTNVFTVPLTNSVPLGGPFTAMLTATDAASNTVSVTRAFRLRGPPPTLQLTRVSPTNGPAPSGSTLVVDVNASGGNGIAQLTANVTGAVTNSFTTNAASLRLQIPIPATTLAGRQVQIVAEAADTLGQSSGPQTLIIPVSDGTPPTLAVVGPTNGTLFLVGQKLDFSAVTSDNSTNAALSLVVSGSVSATQTMSLALAPNEPVTNLFAVTLTNTSPLGGPFTATFTATDAATNIAVLTRAFQLKGPGPTVQITRVIPASGPVPSDSSFVVNVTATSGNGISELTASVTGAVTNGPTTTRGSSLLLQLPVPPDTLAGQTIQIHAEATDTLGRSSGQQTLTLTVSDGTPPTVAILSPPDNTRLSFSQPLNLAALASDNSSNAALTLTLSGSVATARTVNLSLTPNTQITNVFTVPLTNTLPGGGQMTAIVGATDAAGNHSLLATRTYWLPPTQTTTVTWDRQALGQTFSCTNGGGTYSWPNNNNWSQSEVLGRPCGAGELVAVQPSNWSTTNYPDGATNDVVLGNQGGAPANLNISVAINSLTIQTNGGLNLQWGTTLTANSFDFQGDSGITMGGGGGAAPALIVSPGGVPGGMMTKSGGSGVFAIDPGVALNCVGGTISVQTGTLGLPGSASFYGNDTFTVATNAVLDLVPTNNNVEFMGTFSGSGAGQVQLNYGALVGEPATLDFAPGLFQWAGGRMNDVLTNTGDLTLTSTNNHQLWDHPGVSGTSFYNEGLVQHAAGTLDLQSYYVNFYNLASGTYDFTGDGSIISTLWNGTGAFENEGMVRKTGGTNSIISVPVNNIGGTMEVDAGTLTMSGGGNGTSGTITVNGGATLDFAGGTWKWNGNLSATGAGQVQFSSGVLDGAPVTLNFAPGVFQWIGDRMWQTVTNVGTITLTSTNIHRLWDNPGHGGTDFYNAGQVQHEDGPLDLQSQYVHFHNLASGIYDFIGDGSIISTLWNGTGTFDNEGLLRKSGGTNSVIAVPFTNNGGTIEVDRGTLALTQGDFAQNGGNLKIALGGRSAGRFGQLAVSGHATLSGALTVTLTNGFTPAPGDQFPILTSAGISGFFNPVSVPPNCQLRYTNGAVVLAFTAQSNRPPTLQFTQVAPTNATVASGAPFEVDVTASDDDGVAQITANVSGALTNSFTTNSSSLRITGVVPPTAVPGEQVQITAQALDNISQSTGPRMFALPVSDGTPPMVTILSPSQNTLLPLGQPLELSALAADNSTNVMLTLSTSGSLVVTQTLAVALIPNVPMTNVFTVSPTGADPAGGQFTAEVMATDQAGNVSTNARTYWLPPSSPTSLTWQQWRTDGFPSSTAYQVTGGGSFTLNAAATIGTLIIQPDGVLFMDRSGSGSSLTAENFVFQGDGAIMRTNCCGPTTLTLAGGTMEKTGGTNLFNVEPGIKLTSLDGTMAVDLGTLSLPGNNSSYTDGEFNVASNATLNLVPANNTANFTGTFTGSGQGAVLLDGGTLHGANGGANFDLPNFQWSGGAMSGAVMNQGAMTLTGTNDDILANQSEFLNAGTVNHAGSGRLGLNGNGGGTTAFQNLPGGVYDFLTDSSIFENNGTGTLEFDNQGLLRKSGGAGVSAIASGVAFNNQGGSIEVDIGTLVLAGGGTSFGGNFTVASNAVLDLTGGSSPNWSGTVVGSGMGRVQLASGVIHANPNLTLLFPSDLFQWSGGTFAGAITNEGVVTLSGTNASVLANQAQFYNAGTLAHTGNGGLGLNGNGGGTTAFRNLPGSVYEFLADSSVFEYHGGGTLEFDNQGLLWKGGGTNISAIANGVNFNNRGGAIRVDTGELSLNSGSSSNGTFTVAAGAVVDLTGGGNPTWAGTMSGSGAGQVRFSQGAVVASPSLTLNFTNHLFQWNGGAFAGAITNEGVVTLAGTNDSILANQARFWNAGTIKHAGIGRLGLNGNGGGVTAFENLPTGVYDFLTDSSIFENNGTGTLEFDNQGLLRKSGGTGVSAIASGVAFNNQNGTIEVDRGTLVLAGGGSSFNGNFIVASNAVLDLTGGSKPTWSGTVVGSGAGRVQLASGIIRANPNLTLFFPSKLFQWSGGTFAGAITNEGILTLSGTNDSILANQSEFLNAGTVNHTGSGRLGLNGNGGGTTAFQNLPGGVYDFLTDSSIFENNGTGTLEFDNQGLLRKSGGDGVSTIASGIAFNNQNGSIEVDRGTLVLAGGGSSVNGNFIVASNAVLDLTGGSSPTWSGTVVGSGVGRVQLASGVIHANPNLTLLFPSDLFQWSGGTFAGAITNEGVVTLSGTNDSILANQADFYNAGTVDHTGSGRLGLNGNGGGITAFRNLPGGIYDFLTDSSIFENNGTGTLEFDNRGLLRKSGGDGVSAIAGGVAFNNQDGSIEVDRGTLVLAGGGASVGGNFTVASNAVLDLTGGGSPTWAGKVTGSGAGQVRLSSGTIHASPNLTLDFAANLFQWSGGMFAGTITNQGIVMLTGANDSILANQSRFWNAGTVIHAGSGRLGLNGNGGGTTAFENLPTGVYDFLTDSSIFEHNSIGTLEFDNRGLLRKSGGDGVSAIASGVAFNNQNGSIEVDRGTLNLGNSAYAQGTGAFTVTLGGTNAGQFGRLTAGNVTLGGSLHIKLAAGFTASVGTQFQILSGSSLSGTFSSLDVPAGLSINYSATDVVATVTSAISAARPGSTSLYNGPALAISKAVGRRAILQWQSGTNFIVETASSLKPGAIWLPVTNTPITVSNNTLNVALPVTNAVQYFRLRRR